MKYTKSKYFNIIVTVSFSLIFIVPFFIISLYNFPGAADDMYFAIKTPDFTYYQKIIHSYNHYIGRYFNAFFFSLPSEIFMSVWFAQLHPIVDLLILFMSIKYLTSNLDLSKSKVLQLCLVVLAIILAFLPNIQTLYWFAGSTVYFFPFSGLLLFIGLIIKDYYNSLNFVEYVFLYLLIFAVSGSNEIFMTYILYSTIIIIVLKYIFKKPKKVFTILSFIIAVFSTYLVLNSPGTERRFNGEGVGKTTDVIASFLPITFELIWAWLFENGLILVPLLIVLSGKFKLKSINQTTFIFFLFYAITLLLGGVFVITYSLGTEGEILPRVLNIFFMIFVFILVGLGVFLSSVNKIRHENQLAIFTGLIFLFFSKSNNIANVHKDLLTGISKKAQSESIWRFNYLDTVSSKEVIMPRLTQKSKVLMIPDWGAATNWTNRHLATFFDKQTITVNQKTSVEQYIKLSSSIKKIHYSNGFRFWVDIQKNELKVENIDGNIQNSFFCLIYPHDKNVLSNNEVNFLNKSFVFIESKSIHTVQLPDFKIDRILIGQLSNKKRIWSETIFFSPPF